MMHPNPIDRGSARGREAEAAASSRLAVPDAIRRGRVIAISRTVEAASAEALGEALIAGAIHVCEVTMNRPDAIALIARLAGRFAREELLVGAGTVLTVEQARRAIGAGARFIVMPHTDPALIAWASGQGIPSFPGALSPTEILAAWRAGATAVKLFPASSVGPQFVRDLRGPFPDIPLVPTGGITADNARSFVEAGAVALGIGSWLTGAGSAEAIGERAATLAAAVGATQEAAEEAAGAAQVGAR